MPKRVQLPNGDIGEFPDSMSNDQITAVLRKQFPPPAPTMNERLTSPESNEFTKNHPILGAASNFGAGAINAGEQVALHPIRSVEGTIGTLNDVYNADPGTKNPTPETLAARKRLKEQWEQAKQNPAYALGGLVGGTLAGEGIGKVTEGTVNAVPPAFRRGLEAVTQTGPRETAKLVEKTVDANKAATDAATEKNVAQEAKRVQDLKKHYEKTKTEPSSSLESGRPRTAEELASHREALQHGIEKLDTEFQADLKTTQKRVQTEAGQKYDSVRAAVGDASVPSTDLAQAVKQAESNITGSTEKIKEFRDILSKYPENDPDTIEYQGAQIPKTNPLYDVLKEQGVGGNAQPATFSDLQGYYSELGSKLAKRGMPDDIYRAVRDLHESIGNMMQKMAEDRGAGPQFADARKFYRDYMQTFRDRDSPVYKAINAQERGKSSAAFAGKDKTGVEALAKYDPELARRANTLRDYQDEMRSIPKPKAQPYKAPVKLAPKPEPIQAKLKTIGPEDIQAAKLKGLKERVNLIRRRGEWIATGAAGYGVLEAAMRGELGRIPRFIGEGILATASIVGIAKYLEKPEVTAFLTRATPADVAQIPPAMRASFSPVLWAAKQQGIRVSPAFASIGAVTGATTPLAKQSPLQPSTKIVKEDARAEIPPELQNISENLGVKYIQKPGFTADNGENAIASVDPNNPNTININDPNKFNRGPIQTRAHELYHLWRNNLPGPIRAKALPDNPIHPYNLDDLSRLRAQGYTMATIPNEQGARIVQMWAARPEMRKQLQPWIDDMAKTGMSVMEGTDPNQKGINMTPRPPLPPAHAFQMSPVR